MNLSGWGKYPKIKAQISYPSSTKELLELILKKKAIARGNGRSYGDSAISKNNTISMKKFNKIIEFDNKNGLLIVESGVLLSKIIDTFLPKGWFPKITPGSKFVTVGGMVACDVHGKNHHKDGSFRSCIKWISIITADGKIRKCSRKNNSELFNWTVGGMGLTGIILKIAFYLRPVDSSWIKQKTIATKNIDETIKIFEKNLNSLYSVAWIDCLSRGKKLGRSLVMLGEHAKISELNYNIKNNPLKIKKKKKFRIPFNFPSFLLSSFIVKIFNSFYYFFGSKRKGHNLIYFDNYFYPLDYILDWNKIYGYRGFAQFQCVIPLENALKGISELIETISYSKSSSFLSVLKRMGKQKGLISFPMEGYTLALDFPITKNNLELMKKLDKITLKFNGRFYLAKDSRITKDIFLKSDPRFKKYIKFRSSKLNKIFSSTQSERIGL